MVLTAALLAFFNSARGQSKITHVQWVIISSCIIMLDTMNPLMAIMWIGVTLIVTTRATGKTLLIGLRGDKAAIWKGAIKNLPILPVCYFSPWAILLLVQGLIFYIWGCVSKDKTTTWPDYITGLILGALI